MIRRIKLTRLRVAIFVVSAGLVVAYLLAGAGYDLLGRQMARHSWVNIVMNPDSTQFAYALDYHFSPGWFDLRWPASRVEVWTYDLSRKSGPRRIGGWTHDPNADAHLLQWTAEGLYLAYSSSSISSSRPRQEWCDLVNPNLGFHFFIGPPPWDRLRNERPAGVDPNHPEEYRRTRHVEERNGEFFLWDPTTLKLIPLFALPIDPNGWDPDGQNLMRRREIVLREDGCQRIERVDTARSTNGVLLRVHTYARRAAPFARRYRLHLEISSWDRLGPYETAEKFVALWDTLVTPNPPGDTLQVNVPHSRFWKALQPDWLVIKEPGSPYAASLITTLVPDSLPADKGMAPGIRDGRALGNWSSVVVPLP